MRLAMWSKTFLTCSLLFGLLAPLSFGQGGGGGGRGGMMMGGMGRGGGGALALLRMEEVQKELKIDDDQKKQLADLGKKLADETAKINPMAGAGGGGGGGFNFRDMSDEERASFQKKMEEFTTKSAEIVKTHEKSLDDILNPEQADRLMGLIVQRENVRAVLSSDKVAAAIEATAKQKEELAKIQKESNPGFGRGGRGGGAGGAPGGAPGGGAGGPPDMTAIREAMEKARKETDDKMLAVLTDVQKKKLEELKGAKFEFPEAGRGGPGGGRPAGGGRPNRTDN